MISLFAVRLGYTPGAFVATERPNTSWVVPTSGGVEP